jgi:hypothetical protein
VNHHCYFSYRSLSKKKALFPEGFVPKTSSYFFAGATGCCAGLTG